MLYLCMCACTPVDDFFMIYLKFGTNGWTSSLENRSKNHNYIQLDILNKHFLFLDNKLANLCMHSNTK